MYFVIKFLEEDGCEVIPKIWSYKENNNLYTYWPIMGAARKAEKGELPDKEKWKSFQIKLLKESENYKEANKFLKRYIAYNTESDCNFSDNDISTDQLIITDGQLENLSQNIAVEEITNNLISGCINSQRASYTLNDLGDILSNLERRLSNIEANTFSNFEKRLANIEAKVGLVLRNQEEASRRGNGNGTEKEILFPRMENMEEFEKINKDLSSTDRKRQFIKEISSYTCNDFGKSLTSVNDAVATREIWKLFSRYGRDGKKSYMDTEIGKSIICCLHRQHEVREELIFNKLGNYLRNCDRKRKPE